MISALLNQILFHEYAQSTSKIIDLCQHLITLFEQLVCMDNTGNFKNQKADSNNDDHLQNGLLSLIDSLAITAEEKILLEDSIKNFVKYTELFIDNIKEFDRDKRTELLVGYVKILDSIKQRATRMQ
jgi:hypothetical protein